MRKPLSIALWVVQALLFLSFAFAGFLKATAPLAELTQQMAWAGRYDPSTVRFIGIVEILGAVGVLVPSLTRILPKLTPLAAAGLFVIMVLAAQHHLANAEPIVPNLVIGALCAFVIWGRGFAAPIPPR